MPGPDRAARGPQPARLVRATRHENSIRLTTDAAAAIVAFLDTDKRWRREDVVNVPPLLRAALEIGDSETQEDADRLAFDRLAYLFQHRPAFQRGCFGLRLPEGGVAAATIGVEPPRHAPIPEPDTDEGRALDHIGHDNRALLLAELGAPRFPTIEEENKARQFGWRAMVAAHRAGRRATGASIGEAQAEQEVIDLVPGWALAVGLKPVPR
ncbi:hypothetical protein AAFN86_08875 [Roseomonas sp. CAU 1739]|uniref:hypothetical protein n=1 Tax=Roseomonas sp. CAU 1739 TaxID=3140364 RepID=UPI00325A9278